ncbi:MAG: hypothetical protein E7333_05225 [Clostridiales bacterium]|nr:hypothetical protein [Clostridiales bacterium]
MRWTPGATGEVDAMTDKPRKTPLWRRPRFRYGSLSALLLIVLLALMVGFNLLFTHLEKENGWRVDYSFNGLTTQSQATLDVLETLPYPVHIYALFTQGNEDLPLMELLDRYAAASDLITWEQTDVALNPGLLTRFSDDTQTVANDSLIVHCPTTDRWKVLSPADFIGISLNYEQGVYEIAGYTYEQEITSALTFVTKESIPRVLFTQGHGELDEETAAPLTELLTANHYDVTFARLSSMELTPGDLLVFLAPVLDLSDAELKQVQAFVSAGGSLLMVCDYSDPFEDMPNYLSLMRSYGFEPVKGMVIAGQEEPDTYFNNNRQQIIPTMLMGEVTQDLITRGADVLLMTAPRAFLVPQDTDGGLIVTPILSSGNASYLYQPSGASLSLARQEDSPAGPFALALEARRITSAGELSRAMVVGSSPLMTSSQVHSMTDAHAFILRSMEFLLGLAPTDLNIVAKPAFRPQLSVESAVPGSLLLVFLPLTVLAAALIVLLPRRHR